uniref:Putative secreted peptide n=1 Tax=Anopheles braziliensis TaxID=58242 RepID=A0A2M3ZW45_9DIPT
MINVFIILLCFPCTTPFVCWVRTFAAANMKKEAFDNVLNGVVGPGGKAGPGIVRSARGIRWISFKCL